MDTPCASARAVTRGPQYHWFGYYDMPCWDEGGRYILSLGVDFEDRPPRAEDAATIGVSDTLSGAYEALTTTRAFNWQQGAMLYWLPCRAGESEGRREIIFNDRGPDRFVSVVLDVDTGQRTAVGRAHSDVGLGGRYALGLNFARIAQTRPGYGYAGLADPWAEAPHPAEDGVYVIDLATGRDALVVSMYDVWDYLGRPAELASAEMWFNHTLLNPSETAFVFLARWPVGGRPGWKTMMFGANVDGSGLRAILTGGMVSHFDWRNDEEILAWTRIGDEGDHFYLVHVESGRHEIVGRDYLTQDGHCSYSHNGRWIATDTYPDPQTYERTLKVYVPDQDREVAIGRYLSPPPFAGEIRCDLHPRWSPDDRAICFDSVHEGHRQVYVVATPEFEQG
jgi:hypothetical protein